MRVRTRYLDRRPLDEVLRDVGISLYLCPHSTDICDDLLECLSHGSLVIVKLDCYFVERQRELFHEKHGEHTVLVCGYERDRGVFGIVDKDAARVVHYRSGTSRFAELRAAYERYQRTFNPRDLEVTYLTVSETPGTGRRERDDAIVRADALETFRLAHGWRDDERAALGLLHDDLCTASAGESAIAEHVEPLSFTSAPIAFARRSPCWRISGGLQQKSAQGGKLDPAPLARPRNAGVAQWQSN